MRRSRHAFTPKFSWKWKCAKRPSVQKSSSLSWHVPPLSGLAQHSIIINQHEEFSAFFPKKLQTACHLLLYFDAVSNGAWQFLKCRFPVRWEQRKRERQRSKDKAECSCFEEFGGGISFASFLRDWESCANEIFSLEENFLFKLAGFLYFHDFQGFSFEINFFVFLIYWFFSFYQDVCLNVYYMLWFEQLKMCSKVEHSTIILLSSLPLYWKRLKYFVRLLVHWNIYTRFEYNSCLKFKIEFEFQFLIFQFDFLTSDPRVKTIQLLTLTFIQNGAVCFSECKKIVKKLMKISP